MNTSQPVAPITERELFLSRLIDAPRPALSGMDRTGAAQAMVYTPPMDHCTRPVSATGAWPIAWRTRKWGSTKARAKPRINWPNLSPHSDHFPTGETYETA